MSNKEREYINENAIRFEITCVNLKQQYTQNEAPEIKDKFNQRVKLRIKELETEILESKTDKERDNLLVELERVKNLTIEKQDKEIFGKFVLLITNNLFKKSCFNGYTANWRDEFFSKAIEHCFKYIHNFDENKISKRTGKQIKAFAYVTQIVYTAFLDVITKRKKESERLSQQESLNELLKHEVGTLRTKTDSTFYKTLILNYDILDSKIYEDFEKLKQFFISYNKQKTLYYCLDDFKESPDYEKMKQELESKTREVESLKEYFKIDLLPEIIKIQTKDYNSMDLSDILNKFNSLNEYSFRAICVEISKI